MCAVWVGQITSQIDLMRLNLLQEIGDNFNILICTLTLLDSACLIERQIKEMSICIVIQTKRAYRSACLGTTDCTLDIEQCARLRLTLLL